MNITGVRVSGVWVSGEGILLREISPVGNVDHVVRNAAQAVGCLLIFTASAVYDPGKATPNP